MKTTNNTERHMPVTHLKNEGHAAWVLNAVNFGVLPNTPEVMTDMLALFKASEPLAKKFLTNLCSSHMPLNGFMPLTKGSKEYENYKPNENPAPVNYAAQFMNKLRNKI